MCVSLSIWSLQMPLVQAVFESNVDQLSELISQRTEDVNTVVSPPSPPFPPHHTLFLPWSNFLCPSFLPSLPPSSPHSHKSCFPTLNVQDSEKRTALHAAAYRGQAECITVLIQAGKLTHLTNTSCTIITKSCHCRC